jgi:hypothetical protein
MTNDTLYKPCAVANMAYCTTQAIYARIRTGKLKARRIGDRWYVPAEEVAKLIDVPVSELPAPEAA